MIDRLGIQVARFPAANFSLPLSFLLSSLSRSSPIYFALYLVTLCIHCRPSEAKYVRPFIGFKAPRIKAREEE